MPENITVSEFLRETWDDYHSPTTSTFVSRMPLCKNTISGLEESLDYDRSGLTKMKKSIKALYNSGSMHVSNEAYLAENLERLSKNASTRDQEEEIGEAFLKFSRVTKELSALMKNLIQSLNNILLFPLDTFLKGELKGVKGDLKKPFDKATKEYETKFTKIEKEKKQQAKEVGMIRSEVSGPEIAEEMEKERKMFQLQACEYLIKVNEIRTKKGVDLLQHLVEYYQAQTTLFQDGIKTINHFSSFIDGLVGQLRKIKQRQDEERKQLIELRDVLKNSMSSFKEHAHHRLSGGSWIPSSCSSVSGYSLHQLQGNKSHGSQKTGYLLKKSEGRMRRVWQKRRCNIKDGTMSISHQDESKDPVKLNLLTCQVKLVPDDPGKKYFDLISSSKNRTYHFQADDEKEMEEWISVLNNAKEEVLLKAFQDNSNSTSINQSVRELTCSIIERVKQLPGNKTCCDCGAPDPEWLSTNLGILICLECCGIHREVGVHISRTQSIVIDELGTSQLLLARAVGNSNFNDIMEAKLAFDTSLKPKATSGMNKRREFIKAKYEQHKYVIQTCTDKEDLKQELQQAIASKDVFALLQVHAEGLELMTTLPNTENDETSLHMAISQEDGNSLHMVDFIIQNSSISSLDKRTKDGNTALHLCAQLNKSECIKLILRTKPDMASLENIAGQAPLDIAIENNHQLCAELIKAALENRKDLFENVNIDWDLMVEEPQYPLDCYSDDDIDGVPEYKKPRSRPSSVIGINETSSAASVSREAVYRDKGEIETSRPPPLPPPLNKPTTLFASGLNHYSISGAAPSQTNGTLLHTTSYNYNHSGAGGPSLPPLPPKKKPPAPVPPPTSGHTRNWSEPNASFLGHYRTPSDPPPPRFKPPSPENRNTMHVPVGSKVVLQKPAESERQRYSYGSVLPPPLPHPRSTRASSLNSADLTLRNDRSRSRDRIDPGGRVEETQGKDFVAPPVPVPRIKKKSNGKRRCRAKYDCDADNEDELTFKGGEIIIVLHEEEEEWWEGEIDGQPERRGLFPVSFVTMLPN
ncbi:arf-GAP with SH3 domain, ANK repeat and PH domain-containing protein 2 isoform X4 [Octopus sinensis]|uniref:Arf-GAP with SH3 domain, ANK repeat and PH domain-containing protein 2 isoform X4 n=1 Tax=Octopus sinensis TaxID=2607531 RepID=A0A6P7SBQ3_9MOLL|nr:arf-GAP with SH3 domain, ANK repeat and PH domain-containing protein 2 isoform X4 [Octopus sinensis]